MNELFRRLKQRKLVQWTLAYVAAAFALLQGVDIVAQRFGWPEQTMRFVIIALSVGLFVTLVLAYRIFTTIRGGMHFCARWAWPTTN